MLNFVRHSLLLWTKERSRPNDNSLVAALHGSVIGLANSSAAVCAFTGYEGIRS